MPIDTAMFILFVMATAGFIFTPGPIVSLIVAETLRDGPKHGFAVVMGATLVGGLYLTISFFGFATVAALPTIVLDLVRYAGAAYLYFLAFQSFRKPVLQSDPDLPPPQQPVWASFAKAVAICFTSPKTILFFAAFFPQFVDRDLPVKPQLLVLSVTFLVIAFMLDNMWLLLAARAKSWLTQQDKVAVANKIAGGVLATGATFLLIIN